jgi:outer membrane protein TolC
MRLPYTDLPTPKPPHLRAHLLAFALCLSAGLSGAHAENLAEAFEAALHSDTRLSASGRQVSAARSGLVAAKGLAQPQVAVNAGYYRLSDAPEFSVNIPPLPATTLPFAQDRGWMYGVGISVPLYTSGRLDQAGQAADAVLAAAQLDVQRTEQDIKLDVANAYVAVLRAQRQLALAQSGVATLQAHALDVERFLEQGLVARNDMLAARSAVANARQDEIRASTGLAIARATYNRQLGRALDGAVSLEELTPETPTALPGPVGLAERAELQALTRQSEALRHQAAATRAAGRPQVALQAGFDRLQNRYLSKDGVWNVGIAMHWTLFDGAVNDSQGDALAARADALADTRSDLESRIALQVRAAEMLVSDSHARIDLAQVAVTQAQENLRVARDRYQSGVGTNTEVLDAETLRIKSQANHFNAIYDNVLAQQQLKRARGIL